MTTHDSIVLVLCEAWFAWFTGAAYHLLATRRARRDAADATERAEHEAWMETMR